MPLPIVIAYHMIWTGYGWWLPNDVRGSTSRGIATDVLKELGELHSGRKNIQPTRSTLLKFFDAAHSRLDHEPITFNAQDVLAIAQGFRIAIALHKYTCYACVIMPDHIHILIRKHKHQAEEMIFHLQRESHLALRESGLINLEHPVWGGHGWKVFLDEPEDIRRTIRYIEKNPLPLKMPVQKWDFVKEYDGWPLHPGHSPNSPYARRLRERDQRH